MINFGGDLETTTKDHPNLRRPTFPPIDRKYAKPGSPKHSPNTMARHHPVTRIIQNQLHMYLDWIEPLAQRRFLPTAMAMFRDQSLERVRNVVHRVARLTIKPAGWLEKRL